MAELFQYNWYVRPEYDRGQDNEEPGEVEQGYLSAKVLIQRFKEAGGNYRAFKEGTYDFGVEK